MTFVYAEKILNKDNGFETIKVFCDTKINLENTNIGASISKEQRGLIEKYGIVKTTIICPEMCISYAGNIFHAAELFRKLHDKKSFNVSEVNEMALHINKTYGDVEFIISSFEDNKLRLSRITKGIINTDCMNAWIGSEEAFREFQRIRLSRSRENVADQTSQAFLEVVQSGKFAEVGKFVVTAQFFPDYKSFNYDYHYLFQITKPQIVKPQACIIFDTSKESGGFSYQQIPISLEDLILKIDQMESFILFSRSKFCNTQDMNNPQLFSLMLPMLIRENEPGQFVRYQP